MKKGIKIIVFLGVLLLMSGNKIYGQYAYWESQKDFGSFSINFSVSYTGNTAYQTNKYGYSPNDIICQFTINVPMEVTMSHCGSELSNTYLYLTNSSSSSNPISYSEYNDGECVSGEHAFLCRDRKSVV